MSDEAELIQRLDRLEAQIAPLAESAKALGELREELAPLVNEAVQALIVALADVEADFQLEDSEQIQPKSERLKCDFIFCVAP